MFLLFYKIMTPYDVSIGNLKLSDYGAVCTEFPFVVAGSVKDPYSYDWKDEDGIDVYIPAGGLKHDAFDIEFDVAAKGNDLSSTIDTMVHDIAGLGLTTVANTYVGCSYSNAYYTGIKDKEFFYDDNGERVATFTLSFKVTNSN